MSKTSDSIYEKLVCIPLTDHIRRNAILLMEGWYLFLGTFQDTPNLHSKVFYVGYEDEKTNMKLAKTIRALHSSSTKCWLGFADGISGYLHLTL